MKLTVLGGQGAYPTPGHGCSGYLLQHDGFRLLLDPGYATLPVLLDTIGDAAVDAVFVSHEHGDHCADLNPLLRVRHLNGLDPLRVYALPGATDAVLTLDTSMNLTEDAEVHEVRAGDRLSVGPFELRTCALSHFVDNLGVRIEAGEESLTYSGDGGGDPALVDLAAGTSVLLTEATFVDEVPDDSQTKLASAELAGRYATKAGAGRLILTHLWPGTDPEVAAAHAARTFDGLIDVAQPGLTASCRVS